MSATTAVLRAETRLFLREPGSLFWMLVFPSILVVIIGLIPPFREPGANGLRVVDMYVPIAALLAMIMGALQALPPVLTGYRERGILRRLSVTPVRPYALLATQIGLHAASVLGSTLLVLAVGRLAFGVALPGQPVGYVVALVLATLAALSIGAAISAVATTTKAVTAIGSVVFIASMFTAGVWVPIQVLPETMRQIIGATPFGAAVRALDQTMAGSWPSLLHLGVTALWTVVLVAVAVRWFRWE
ncbi:MAG: ABC transporter permease [Streptosporangiales bacterium]|nr:ABC transporter permease [Streptosporangiales bacterium]